MVDRQLKFEAIGTRWDIKAVTDRSDHEWVGLEGMIMQRIEAFDQSYSRFRKDSLVTQMSHEAGRYELPGDAGPLLSLYERLYRLTDGLVTPLIGQLMSDAGYDAEYSLQGKPLQAPPAWDEVLRLSPGELTLVRPALLDFGAAGKGYLIDLVGGLMERQGVDRYVINAGGDIRQRDPQGLAVRVGLENPLASDQALGVVQLANRSICGSSGSRRSWGEYHHVMNPKALQSENSVLATWVIADDALIADGLATALFFVEAERLAGEFEFEYAVLGHTMEMRYSKSFPGELFIGSQR